MIAMFGHVCSFYLFLFTQKKQVRTSGVAREQLFTAGIQNIR